MIIEGDFYYKGALRLSWGFGSPNQLGAFVAAALPAMWALSAAIPTTLATARVSTERVRAWLLGAQAVVGLVELCLWLAIGATGSRGAAVAALGAAVLWSISCLQLNRPNWRKVMIWFGLRVGMCILGMVAFSFGGRIAPGFLSQDNSIGNRLALWGGASTLIAASPSTGWGVGESGNAFMQWVQSLDRTESYRTMVNSFLHVGVERGLLIFGLLLWTTFLGISWGLFLSRSIKTSSMKAWVQASSCIIFSWALCNVFSTLFKDWRLWIIPGAAVVVLIISLSIARPMTSLVLRWMGCAFGAAVAVSISIFLWGKWSNLENAIQLSHPAKEVLFLSRGANKDNPRWGLLIDKNVLGQRYGHEIRRWGNESDLPWSVAVFDNRFIWADSPEVAEVDAWILMGETAAQADFLHQGKDVVFMHPRGQLPERWNGRGVVILNGVDEDGSQEYWLQWAHANKLRIETITAVGLDARAEWPLAYMSYFEISP